MDTKIETGIPMPETTGRGKGNTKMNLIWNVLGKFTSVGQSYLFPMASFAKAETERRDYVYYANKYGKAHNTEYVVAAVDGTPAQAAVEADEANGVEAKPAVPARPAGIRIWLKTEAPKAEQPAEAPKAEQPAEAPEVNA